MTGTDKSARPVDHFESARLTVLQHVGDRTCFHCTDNECRQHAWAVEEWPATLNGPLTQRMRTPCIDVASG
ncbi:hypothetical protein [Micromonospora sp. NPDC049171]|uniref:hypothetical protein n=1 Tax=Micromonospora sp. NPDC049171 TaxID=3155770 RepID=UPI0033D8DEC2